MIAMPVKRATSLPAPAEFLIQTKFLPPLYSRGGIVRERQLTALAQSSPARLVVLLAPAGYGKTTLMGQWRECVQRNGGATSWLTLDAADNDPVRLAACLYGALRDWLTACTAGECIAVVAQTDWMSVLDSISPTAAPITFFLDEFEQLTSPAALDTVRLLVSRLPRQARLVIGSRDKPQLGLERHRVRGELFELTAGSLRFDAAETRRFFEMHIAEPLSTSTIERIQSITDGWPAALQLTALAARNRDELNRYAADLSGSLVHIADYLAEDVLKGLSDEIRSFLLQTCGLPRLNAEACDAATGRTDAQKILQHLERNGLFTLPLDAAHKWYRYHPLFTEFLRVQQQIALSRTQVIAIHRAGAQWFAQHGTALEAIDLWLLASDYEAAAREMTKCSRNLVMQAQFSTIQRWLERLDADALEQADPELLLAGAWASGLGGAGDSSITWVTRLKRALAGLDDSDPRKAGINDDLLAFECVQMTLRGDTRLALRSGLAHWRKIGAHCNFSSGAVANTVSYCLMVEGDFALARSFSETARAYNTEIGSMLGLGYAISIAGLIEAIQGNFDKALEQSRTVDNLATANLRQYWFETMHVKIAFVGLQAGILYERDLLDDANELLQRYMPLTVHQPSVDLRLSSHITWARLKLAQGDTAGALDALDRAEKDTIDSALPVRVQRIITYEKMRIYFACGRSDEALLHSDVLERAQLDVPPGANARDDVHDGLWFAEEFFCGHATWWIRTAIARGQIDPAISRLDREIALAEATGRGWRLLKLRLLRILALDAAGSEPEARTELVRALQLGNRIGARRSFKEEGERLEALVSELPVQAMSELPDVQAVTRYWLDLRGEASAPGGSNQAAQGLLSDRELSIIRLLATGKGNEQIATSLFLSINTVKWHIRRILEKLQARNRSEAVFMANKRGLLAQ